MQSQSFAHVDPDLSVERRSLEARIKRREALGAEIVAAKARLPELEAAMNVDIELYSEAIEAEQAVEVAISAAEDEVAALILANGVLTANGDMHPVVAKAAAKMAAFLALRGPVREARRLRHVATQGHQIPDIRGLEESYAALSESIGRDGGLLGQIHGPAGQAIRRLVDRVGL